MFHTNKSTHCDNPLTLKLLFPLFNCPHQTILALSKAGLQRNHRNRVHLFAQIVTSFMSTAP